MSSILKQFFGLSPSLPPISMNDPNGFVQPDTRFYQIVSKTLQNHPSTSDTQTIPTDVLNLFSEIITNEDETPYFNSTNKLIKFAFHKRGILSDFILNTTVEFTSSRLSTVPSFSSPSAFLNQAVGIVSVGGTSSLFSLYGTQQPLYPIVPFTFFGASVDYSNSDLISSNPPTVLYRLFPFIQQGFAVISSDGIKLYFVKKFSQSYVYPSQESDPSSQLSTLSHVLFKKDDKIKFILKKQNYLDESLSVYRTRYVLTVRNSSSSSSYSESTVVFRVPIVKTRLETAEFYPNVSETLPIDENSFLVSSYVDRLGWFESCNLDNLDNDTSSLSEGNFIVSLNPKVSEFVISVSAPTTSGNVALSDSVGLGYGITEFDSPSSNSTLLYGRSFLSEYKRIEDKNLVILASQFLSFEDVKTLLQKNIQLLSPKNLIVLLGLDTVGRQYYEHESMFSNLTTSEHIFTPLSFVVKPDTTLSSSDNDIFTNFKLLFEGMVNEALNVGSKIIVGFPPIIVSSVIGSPFFEKKYTADTTSVLPVMLNFSDYLSSQSSAYDFYISLREEFGNRTSYNIKYQTKLSSLPSGDAYSRLFFNSVGHEELKRLLLGVMRSSILTISSLMNQRQLDVRIGITKFFNSQKVYSIQDNQNYSVRYDAKLDILLKKTIDGDEFEEIALGTVRDHNFLVVVPYFGSVVLKLKYLDQSESQLMLIPNRPTVLFVPFEKIFLKNNSLKEIPVTIILGKTI